MQSTPSTQGKLSKQSKQSKTDLEKRTLQYWRVSRKYCDPSVGPITTEEAIKELRAVHNHIGSHRKLCPLVVKMLDEIIYGREGNLHDQAKV